MIRWLAAIALCVAGAAQAEVIRFEQDGLPRHFQLFTPSETTGPLPLVLVLHGAFQNDERMRRTTRGTWEGLADYEGIAVAFPSAHLRFWDVPGLGGSVGETVARDDFAYLDRVIAEAGARTEIDPDRVFLAGLSMGGQLAYAYACSRPGVRAIATVAMPLPASLVAGCRTGPALPALIVHGTEDPIVPIVGGTLPAGPTTATPLVSHARTQAIFARRAGCDRAEEDRRYDFKDDGTVAIFTRWHGCAAPVWALTIEGMGHRWPGGGPDLPEAIIGPQTEEVDGASFVWSFFDQFR
jgi:polyhydroxybutyrate depolymerase